uniref:Lipoprotein n=1 Tax=Candidatus Kentrum sp. SD TaxID=2126332 RepID=A0A450YHJ8_9GAMM|nr:MAG: hypothetical protein BECKSD772E_GA0070983_100914 [Candidatus Kentron sp. SD]
MKIYSHIRLGIILTLLLLSGCNALQIREANSDLTALYKAKEAALEENPMMLSSALASLGDLADLAKQAAEDAEKEGKLANAISFYRIAATAAWQARGTDVISFTEQGTRLCKANSDVPPRDCAMLAVIPNLAVVDEQNRELNELLERMESDYQRNEADAKKVTSIFKDFSFGLNQLLNKRESLRSAAHRPPADFFHALDYNIGELLCTKLVGLESVIGRVTKSGNPVRDKWKDAFEKNKARAKKAGISTKQARCIAQ